MPVRRRTCVVAGEGVYLLGGEQAGGTVVHVHRRARFSPLTRPGEEGGYVRGYALQRGARTAQPRGEDRMESQPGVVIQRQIKLPFSQAFKISLRNITLRLGRAAVTAASIFLAIAFLSSVLTTRVILDTTAQVEKDAGRVEKVDEAASLPAGESADTAPGGAPLAIEAVETEGGGKKAEEARQWWLVAMSLLVCLAGITNAMLMSVTERFREIGTMKCLGALDSFVVRLFLIESTLLGVLGSAVGAICGALLILLVYCIKEGFSLPVQIHTAGGTSRWPELLAYLGASVAVGAVIALVAAIAPAIRAARLPPAAALRTEI